MDLFFFCYGEPLRHTYLSKSLNYIEILSCVAIWGCFIVKMLKRGGHCPQDHPLPCHLYHLYLIDIISEPKTIQFLVYPPFLLLIVTWTRHSLWHFDHLHYSWSSIPNKYWFIPYHTAIIRCTSYQWIGLREQNTGTPYILIGKTMVSGEDVPFNRSLTLESSSGFHTEEQLCSRCFYFNALAPALALGSDFRSVDPQEEAGQSLFEMMSMAISGT